MNPGELQALKARALCVDLTDDDFAIPSSPSTSFTCLVCAATLPLDVLLGLNGCTCTVCRPCLQHTAAQHLVKNTALLLNSATLGRAAVERTAPCPVAGCTAGRMSLLDLQELAPDEFHRWNAAATRAVLSMSGNCVTCPNPGCGATIEKLPPAPSAAASSSSRELDPWGDPLTPEAAAHKATHRYVCGFCRKTFCGSCLAAPYHLGLSCEQHALPDCRYCGRKRLGAAPPSADELAACGLVDLRRRVTAAGADRSWVLEKGELVHILVACIGPICERRECR